MRATLRPRLFLATATTLLALGLSESSAQYPVQNPSLIPAPVASPPPQAGLSGLRSEFADDIRYPFRAFSQLFRPQPSRIALRPGFDGQLVPTPVPPAPVKPLYISGYAGSRPPTPRPQLVPTTHGQTHGLHGTVRSWGHGGH